MAGFACDVLQMGLGKMNDEFFNAVHYVQYFPIL